MLIIKKSEVVESIVSLANSSLKVNMLLKIVKLVDSN